MDIPANMSLAMMSLGEGNVQTTFKSSSQTLLSLPLKATLQELNAKLDKARKDADDHVKRLENELVSSRPLQIPC